MSDPTLHNLTGALASIAAQEQHAASSQTLDTQMHTDAPEPSQSQTQPTQPMPPGGQPMQGISIQGPEAPVKRRPGRPKGSGKKQLDPNAEPKIKRPVGRPRKDGLPAGSVGPKRPNRPRKRAPGTFASGPGSAAPGMFYGHYGEQWPTSISAPPMGVLNGRPPQIPFPLDPNLTQNWSDLSRTRPDVFLHALVASMSAPNPISAAGPSVEEAFKNHLLSLASNGKNPPGTASIPTLYSILKTFWLPSSPMYFSLTASASASRTPSEHRFLYWDPQPLVFNGISCPACNAPLINKGRIVSGPIKVYDLGKPFFVIGCEYVCESATCLPPGSGSEGRKFSSTDASILRSLPSGLRSEFPARLIEGQAGQSPDLGSGPDVWGWRGMGVSNSLWNMVRASLRAGLQKDAILGVIRGIIDGVPDEYPPWAYQVPPGLPMMSDAKGEAGPSGEHHKDDDEGEEEDEEEDEVVGDLQHGEKDDHPPPPSSPPEDYHEPWQGHPPHQEPAVADPSEQPNGQPAPPPQVPVPAPADLASPPVHPPPPVIAAAPPPEFAHTFVQQPPPYIPYGFGTQAPPPPPLPFGYYIPAPSASPAPPSTMKRTFAVMDGGHDPNLSEPQKRLTTFDAVVSQDGEIACGEWLPKLAEALHKSGAINIADIGELTSEELKKRISSRPSGLFTMTVRASDSRPQGPARAIKIVILGGTGYIGGVVVDGLLKHPQSSRFELIAFVRSEEKAKQIEGAGLGNLKAVSGSLTTLEDVVADAAVVFNLASSDDLPLTQAILDGAKKRFAATTVPLVLIHTGGAGVISDAAMGQFTSTKVYDDAGDEAALDALPESTWHRNVDIPLAAAHKEGYVKTYNIAPPLVWGLATGALVDAGLQSPVPTCIVIMSRLAIFRGQFGYAGPMLNSWSTVEVHDLARLELMIFDAVVLEGKEIAGGNAYYFTANGDAVSKEWIPKLAEALYKGGAIKTPDVSDVTPEELQKWSVLAAFAVNVRASDSRSRSLGWKPTKTKDDFVASIEENAKVVLKQPGMGASWAVFP
ncbi:hypothetical protein EIP91_007714 [Steccherinum ochraceum]|uniref:NAD(P)-binding domain-containing protein n=1 Tax=Steccherinum ochraceum TaxID=92696 RepID=A0A4R0R3Z1_9APHY|nr:hypothetical protein EIP91_007714 [Steccherinum ochraceum]